MSSAAEASKTQRLYLLLRHRIVSGELGVGDKLPSEPELGSLHGVSRVTVRRVLGQLEEEGLISRQPGIGTFVQHDGFRHPVKADLANVLAGLTEMGRATTARLLSFTYVKPPAPIARALRIAPDERTQRSVRIRAVHGEPFSYLLVHVPESIGMTYSEKELASKSLLGLLERSGVVIGRAMQTVTATLATPQLADALNIDIGAPLLGITRVIYDADEQGVQHLQAFYRPDRFIFQMELVRSKQQNQFVWAPSAGKPARKSKRSVYA